VARRKATRSARAAPAPPKQNAGATPVATSRRQETPTRLRGDPAGETGAEPEALTITHWFASGDEGEPYAATVRFRGRRIGLVGPSAGRDAFVQDELIRGIVPGSGPVSITTRAYGLKAGDWTVTAELVAAKSVNARRLSGSGRQGRGHTLPRAAWSWRRWALSSGSFEPVATRWAPLARLVSPPAVIPGSWSGLVGLGVVVGLALHSVLLAREGVPIGAPLAVNVVSSVAGLIGAKLRYITLHPRTWRDTPGEGWAVDGFLVVMPIVALAGMLVFELPIGLFLDAGAPALMFGVAIGRLGCFFTGCCAGRCTRSRWGIWSSDRRVGARRIPTQLLESAAGLVIGVVTLALFLFLRPPLEGMIFLGALAAYTLVRRVLLRLRAERQPVPSAA
jgi:phosphatidylglycerol:prolipoprotein diacylglycerol transferase